jgi:hypothetical protein
MQRLRAAARRSAFYRPYVRWKYRVSPNARRSYFAGMYRENVWGDETSRSGSGSNLANTATLRAELPRFLAELEVRSLLDLPCGDWAWMRHVDLSAIDRYVGGEIVSELVERLSLEHGRPGVEFVQLDGLSGELPTVDAVMVRDLFGHLDHMQIRRLVRNVKRSGAKWLLASHYPSVEDNSDVEMGAWRPQNFTLPPYRWPEPRRMLWEHPPTERNDKTLSAWTVSELR